MTACAASVKCFRSVFPDRRHEKTVRRGMDDHEVIDVLPSVGFPTGRANYERGLAATDG